MWKPNGAAVNDMAGKQADEKVLQKCRRVIFKKDGGDGAEEVIRQIEQVPFAALGVGLEE